MTKKDIRSRQHLIERSFARACRYGFKRSRWRRLWRNQVKEYLTAAIQNIMILLGRNVKSGVAMALAMMEMKHQIKGNNADDTRVLPSKWIDTIFESMQKTLFCRNLILLYQRVAL